jgi:hypothetical protein
MWCYTYSYEVPGIYGAWAIIGGRRVFVPREHFGAFAGHGGQFAFHGGHFGGFHGSAGHGRG